MSQAFKQFQGQHSYWQQRVQLVTGSQGNFLVTWNDVFYAAYSIYYSNNPPIWSSPTFIMNSDGTKDVTSSFDGSTGNFLLTWMDPYSNCRF